MPESATPEEVDRFRKQSVLQQQLLLTRDRRFDECALAFVRGIRFRPGLDHQGSPLNVWLHAYVSATDCHDGRRAQRLRTEF